ncbi:DUF3757 domain-containing protein [Pseudomonas sp. TH34]|uniref:DUF3757 domain-containing protein n=1 Tax=Pseudomonas yamanorum TaxID=515393 RepID=A0AAJ3GZG9_9PSED|nr:MULTISPECIES: DUF3757 domain-containing protein [Pseudomonas]AMW83808.1 hypothetical protein AK972_3008 [Pseudomonas yamanorum]MBK5408928.1 DUF3757 domain-containing protein [Pseudomonas sp. TH34]NWD40578.1 DUF3757 domain-containing protein [Pseudomonas yamanorum]WVN20022.1 DUF3757 domain-containing protein [Pseudomonas yamanorum]
MNRQLKKTSALVMTLMALAGNAYAGTAACPPTDALKDAFKKTPTGEVVAYTASGPGGQQWTGKNPMTEQKELHQVQFEKAVIQSSQGQSSVACHYLDQNHEPVSMTLKNPVNAKPVGGAWTGNECKATNPALCTFE